MVGIDGSTGGNRALEWAAAQAARSGAVLEGHAGYNPGYVFVSRDEVETSLQKALEKAAAGVAGNSAGRGFGKGVAHEGSPAKDLIRQAREPIS